MLPRLSLLCVPYVLSVAALPSLLHAQQPFLERYALAADRAAVLKDLVPGTEDYYFYHVLYHQTQGRQDQAAKLLEAWQSASPGQNPRRELLRNRAEILAYDKDPAATLAWLKKRLSLEFNHQRQTEEARAELPVSLDPALVSFAAFEKKALEGTDDLQHITDPGLYRLSQPVEKWKLSEIRSLLKRLTRPDFPKLVDIIDRELREKDAAFGNFPIHTLLTSDQLADLQKRRPALLNNETFTSAVMTRMRPLSLEDADRDPAVRAAWLERLWTYAATLPPKANPLRANLLYHLLAHDEKQGRLDSQRLLAYLKLPRPVSYVNPRFQEDKDIWKFPAPLDFDPSAFTGTTPVGNDEPLIRRLVIRYLTTAENTDSLAPLVNDVWLRGALAEAKLLSGAPAPERWVSLLPPEAYQKLRERTDIEFDAAARQTWAPDDVVTLDVWLKNVPSLLIRVYEINTANVHRTGEEVNTGLDLDGLTANSEQKFDYKDAPILRNRQTFSFPSLNNQRGVWIIEFIGNGKASRALIRKGGLRTVVRQTSAGTMVTVLDEKLKPVPDAFAMIGPKQFRAKENGFIHLPLSTQPGPQKVIFDNGTGFTSLETIELQGESYKLDAGFHVPRESLLPGTTATLLIRPRLLSNGRPVPLKSLEKVKVTISSLTLDGTPASVVTTLEKLTEDQETTVNFTVPDRLHALNFQLTAEMKSTVTGVPAQLGASGSLEVNTITAFGEPGDVHLSKSGDQWMLQLLGLNGESRAGREVTVTLRRPEFSTHVEVLMKSDAAGTVILGALDGITSVDAQHGPVRHSFTLDGRRVSNPATVHLLEGQSLLAPWPDDHAPAPGDVSLTELAGAFPRRLVPVPAPLKGYLIWKNLTPGTWRLHLPDGDHHVVIARGQVVDGYALSPTSTVRLAPNRPLTVAGLAEATAKLPDGKTDPSLVFFIGNTSPETRVHILTSRFLPEFDAMAALGRTPGSELTATLSSWLPSSYLSARNIGDEYRYVLERRGAARFAGNMLSRPGLLLNPWEIAETKMEKELLEEMEKARNELLPKAEAAPAPPLGETGIPAPHGPKSGEMIPIIEPDLSFLASAAPALLNLRPAADGTVTISRSALGDRQFVRVLVLDRDSSAMRDFALPSAARPARDLRLSRQLNPAQHFSRQDRISVVEKDAAFRFDDALAAQFQPVGHLGAVQQVFFNLTRNPLLQEFSWLLEWPSFDEAKKRSLYSQYACHELHFFLYRKDRPFFDAVVKPYLASKRERTFMDDFLLDADLTRYLQPWQYGRLNALECILLAQRLPQEAPVARRRAEDWMSIQPVNRQRDSFLFETVLRGRSLIADQRQTTVTSAGTYQIPAGQTSNMGRRVAWDANQNWYFGNNFSVEEYASPNDPGTVPLPWGGIAGAPGDPSAVYRYNREHARGHLPLQDANLRQPADRAKADIASFDAAGANGTELKRLYSKGLGYADLGQFNEAEKEFGKILSVDPNNAAARRQLERLQSQTSDYLKSARDETRLRVLSSDESLWVARGGLSLDGMVNIQGNDIPTIPTGEFSPPQIPQTFGGGGQGLNGKEAEYKLDGMTTGVNGLGLITPVDTGDSGVNVKYITDLDAVAAADRPADAGRLFRQQDPTKVWAEQQYYRLKPEDQTPGLIPMNRFWRDYAVWDGKGGFLSANIADAAGSFPGMVLALAVLDLPFPGDYKPAKLDRQEDALTVTPASRLLLFHQDILPTEVDNAGTKLLVNQNFYREGDRYIEEGGEKTDKFVSAEFLTGTVYGCQVVVTNPSSAPQRVDVLFQIPAGALPMKATRRVQSLPVTLEAWRTQTLDFHFYFPEPGKFEHFPVHISRDAKTTASAPAFTFNVVAKSAINDPASWDYVSQHGTNKDVLSFLEQHNVYYLDLSQILWRLKDADFFRSVITHLKSRHIFDGGVWSYAVLHNAQPYLSEYLAGTELNAACGPVLDAPLLTIDPVEQRTYQHLEYTPLINARAHRLGAAWDIMNDKFRSQWGSLMQVLAFRPNINSEDQLAVAGYLALQDRVEEALAAFARVDQTAVAEKLQYQYLRAWLAMCQEDTVTARRIASALLAHPVKHWRDKFAILTAQLDELEGKPSTAPDMTDRDTSQDTLADREPSLVLAVKDKVVAIRYHNLTEVTVNYYPVDLEFLFSANPFIAAGTARFNNIRPAASEKHMLPAGAETFNVALPALFHSQAVLVEITSGATSKSIPVFAHTLDVQMSEGFGQLTVQHAGKPLPKVYVKVFADMNGKPTFYKDGYTDLRGKFDYASLSTSDLNTARRFSILISSDTHGALVQEVAPPAR